VASRQSAAPVQARRVSIISNERGLPNPQQPPTPYCRQRHSRFFFAGQQSLGILVGENQGLSPLHSPRSRVLRAHHRQLLRVGRPPVGQTPCALEERANKRLSAFRSSSSPHGYYEYNPIPHHLRALRFLTLTSLSLSLSLSLSHLGSSSHTSMTSYPSSHSPSLRKMNGAMEAPARRGRRRGSSRKFSLANIFGDPFALATISIAIVCPASK
jgi:hypothetical protein